MSALARTALPKKGLMHLVARRLVHFPKIPGMGPSRVFYFFNWRWAFFVNRDAKGQEQEYGVL